MGKSVEFEAEKVKKRLDEMIKVGSLFEQYVITRFQPMFRRAQQKRWQTENASEGSTWNPITNLSYLYWKHDTFQDSFGHGEKLMIASGRLYSALTLAESGDWERILGKKTIVFNFPIEYAAFAAAIRPITEFSKTTMDKFRKDFKTWVGDKWQRKI